MHLEEQNKILKNYGDVIQEKKRKGIMNLPYYPPEKNTREIISV